MFTALLSLLQPAIQEFHRLNMLVQMLCGRLSKHVSQLGLHKHEPIVIPRSSLFVSPSLPPHRVIGLLPVNVGYGDKPDLRWEEDREVTSHCMVNLNKVGDDEELSHRSGTVECAKVGMARQFMDSSSGLCSIGRCVVAVCERAASCECLGDVSFISGPSRR
jgi:hypothetical protein